MSLTSVVLITVDYINIHVGGSSSWRELQFFCLHIRCRHYCSALLFLCNTKKTHNFFFVAEWMNKIGVGSWHDQECQIELMGGFIVVYLVDPLTWANTSNETFITPPGLLICTRKESKISICVFGDQQTYFFWVIDDVVGFQEDQIELLISYIIAFFALHLHLGAVLSLIWLQVWTQCCLDWSSSLDILGLSAVSYLRANCWVGR
jgi:hypothetical protein